MTSARRYAPLLLVLVGFLLVNLFAVSTKPTGKFDPIADRSSYRFNRFGYRALYRLFAQLGYPVKRVETSLDYALEDVAQLWLINPREPINTKELRSLRQWVTEGGMLVCAFDRFCRNSCVFPEGPVSEECFPELAQVEHTDEIYSHDVYLLQSGLDEIEPSVVTYSGSESRRAKSYGVDVSTIQAPHTARLTGDAAEALALATDGAGVALARIAVGQGEVIVTSDADLFANRWLNKADNVILAVNLAHAAGPGSIAFDEYHHGFREVGRLNDVISAFPGRAGLWQLLGVALVALLAVARRFGAPMRFRQPPRRSVLEYVDSMALLYERAEARTVAVEALEKGARRRLAARTGLPPSTDDAELLARVGLLKIGDPLLVRAILTRAKAARSRCESDAELMDVARQLDDQLKVTGPRGSVCLYA